MNLRIFAVGIEHYQHPKIPKVTFAENDAKAFVDAWDQLAIIVDKVVLLSSQATQAAMWSRFKTFMADVTADDTVVIFYAGHGHKTGDTNYITCHDTQPGDISGTSLPLEDMFSLLRKLKSKRIMLFLDSCHSGMPTQEGMRSIVSEFSPDELKAFCKDSEFHIGFASCKVDQYSWPSLALKHGIWTYCIVQALTGKAKKAFEKAALITDKSLANYLSVEVPLSIQKIRTGNEVQTPCVFGNSTKTFIVADLEPLMNQRRAMSAEGSFGLKKVLFRREYIGRIDKLSGFKKGKHRVPDDVGDWANNFIQNIGNQEVTKVAKNLHDGIKHVYEFTRRELSLEDSRGSASIITPEFRVDISIGQDTDNAAQYRILLEVTEFKTQEVIASEYFERVFSGHCDTLVVQFDRPISIENKIDEIEEIRELKKNLQYEPDLSELTLLLPDANLKMRMTTTEALFFVPGSTDVKLLFESYRNSMKALAGSGLKLLT